MQMAKKTLKKHRNDLKPIKFSQARNKFMNEEKHSEEREFCYDMMYDLREYLKMKNLSEEMELYKLDDILQEYVVTIEDDSSKLCGFVNFLQFVFKINFDNNEEYTLKKTFKTTRDVLFRDEQDYTGGTTHANRHDTEETEN